MLGGRIGYVLFYNPAHFAAHPLEIFQVWTGGMSFHGGFIGCVLAVVLFARQRGISILSLGDLTCAAGPIGICLGRIANFINGELWGRPTDVPWAFIFPAAARCRGIRSQLYESALEGLLLFCILAFAIRLGALKTAGPRHRLVRHRLCAGAVPSANCSVSRMRSSAFLWGGHDHGHAVVDPAVSSRASTLSCTRCASPPLGGKPA